MQAGACTALVGHSWEAWVYPPRPTNTHAHTQICRKLRALFGVEQVPIVMCTAMGAGSSALNKCKGAGATDVLLKPFERAKMLDQVQRHCSHKVGGGGGRQAWALGTHTRLPQV